MKTKTITITKEQLEKAIGENCKCKQCGFTSTYHLPDTITLEIPDNQIEKSSPADLPELPKELYGIFQPYKKEGIVVSLKGGEELLETINQLINWAKAVERKLVDKI